MEPLTRGFVRRRLPVPSRPAMWQVGCVADTTNRVQNVEGLTLERVGYRTVDAEALPQLNRYLSNK